MVTSDTIKIEDTFDLMIRGNIVLSGEILSDGVICIRDGIIEGFAKSTASLTSKDFIEAKGCLVLPGAVDAHVHSFSAPQEGFIHATRAAAAGGVTTIVDMPYDFGAAVTNGEIFSSKKDRIEKEAIVDVGLLGTIKKTGGLDQIDTLSELGVCGFKASVYETDPDRFPAIPDGELFEAFKLIKEKGLSIGLHAENDNIVKRGVERERARGIITPLAHNLSRPYVAEAEAVSRALEFAYWSKARLHIYHATFPRIFEMVQYYKKQGVNVTAETCTHYLMFNENDLNTMRGLVKVNPPLRSEEDQEKLWQLCKNGDVDIISSDHAPWPLKLKQKDNIMDCAAGTPGVETLLPIMYSEGVAKERMDIYQLTKMVAENPARLYGFYPKKGRIAIGADADLAIINPDVEWVLDEKMQQSTAGWNPFNGKRLKGKVTQTLVRGKCVYQDGDICVEPGYGKFVRPTKQGEGRTK